MTRSAWEMRSTRSSNMTSPSGTRWTGRGGDHPQALDLLVVHRVVDVHHQLEAGRTAALRRRLVVALDLEVADLQPLRSAYIWSVIAVQAAGSRRAAPAASGRRPHPSSVGSSTVMPCWRMWTPWRKCSSRTARALTFIVHPGSGPNAQYGTAPIMAGATARNGPRHAVSRGRHPPTYTPAASPGRSAAW